MYFERHYVVLSFIKYINTFSKAISNLLPHRIHISTSNSPQHTKMSTTCTNYSIAHSCTFIWMKSWVVFPEVPGFQGKVNKHVFRKRFLCFKHVNKWNLKQSFTYTSMAYHKDKVFLGCSSVRSKWNIQPYIQNSRQLHGAWNIWLCD